MKKRIVASLLAAVLVMSACGSTQTTQQEPAKEPTTETQTESTEKGESKPDETAEKPAEDESTAAESSGKVYYDVNLVPSMEPYSVAEDFSNVVYEKDFAYLFEPDYQYAADYAADLRQALIKNNFAVVKGYGDEFFDIYEDNRYLVFPSFVTVDSLMHTYHLYFAYLMKQTEKNHLASKVKSLGQAMMDESVKQYKDLEATDWDDAALRNMEFFYVAEMLQDNTVSEVPNDAIFDSTVKGEYDKIMAAGGIFGCELTGRMEDYTQYKPRGYYDGDEELEKYFRTMMWYGRIPFAFESEEMVKSAILMCLAINKAPEDWKNIYDTTSFFAGNSDDPGYDQVIKVIESAYGGIPEAKDLAGNAEAFTTCVSELQKLDPPKINSIPVMEGQNPIIPSFRLMGQRFTIDAAIMQRLVYSAVEENENGDRRYLPDTLDVPAALGSEVAMEILESQGATGYKNYTDNLQFAKEYFNNADPNLWDASLYSGWLNILRPLFEQKKEGYPSYMQNEEWTKKNLETFAGSFAELKHDTILYSKQLMAEMGGGDMDTMDDRGYVDPQPVVFSRFVALSEKTKEGLDKMGMLGSEEKENLDKLSEIGMRLIEISEKELTNAEITDDDYEFIRCYGGYIEHFWQEVNKDKGENLDSYEAPCPIVADIATDPNGTILEVGTGLADNVYVVFPIDGELHVGRGSCYSFYQFEMPITQRLTDAEWRGMLHGGYLDDEWNWVVAEEPPKQPEWTNSYRVGNK